MTPTNSAKARTDSTDRTPALTSAKSTAQPKSATRLDAARRLLSALMRSLASPHV